MRISTLFYQNRDAIREIALQHRVVNVRVFGSVLHGADTDESDLDLLVDPTQETTLMDIAKIQLEVAKLLNITVDVLTPNNKLRRCLDTCVLRLTKIFQYVQLAQFSENNKELKGENSTRR